MPVKDIELGSGSLYFEGLDEPIPVSEGQVTYEEEFADGQEYIKLSSEPCEFTLKNVEFPRGWALTECRECGYKFPVTEVYILMYGSSEWLCPMCTFVKRLEEARKKENI